MTSFSPTFVPEDFYCPITGHLMDHPVSCPEGHTYEKSAITTWLQEKGTCPMTRARLSVSDLVPNKAMNRSIESIRAKLTDDQLQIDRKITQLTQKPFQDALAKISLNHSDNLVTIGMPEVSTRPPADIALCIDVSGSMGAEATLKSSSGENVGDGFSVLSLTIAAAKTIMATMNEHDHLSIVTYTNKARTIVSHEACTPDNKKIIAAELDTLKPLYTTNIWDGLHQSMEILRTTAPKERLQAVFLLTDGIPNIEPPRGHEGMLEKYFQTHDYRCMINCYGFGYQLKSDLLQNISKISGGDGFSYIPDASLLGNIFIHGISNTFTTAVTNPTLNVVFADDTIDTVQIDSLKYGQDTHLMVHSSLNPETPIKSLTLISDSMGALATSSLASSAKDKDQLCRLQACSILAIALEKQTCGDTSYRPPLNAFIEEMAGSDPSPYIQNILHDFRDQVKQGLNMTVEGQMHGWFGRWGKHYIRSLLGAYQRELCNNFKDKGVSNFGGTLFGTIRDEVSDIFDDMPPPKRDVAVRATRGPTRGPSANASTMSMQSYNSSAGPCCASGSLAWVKGKRAGEGILKKPVEELVKGDLVYTMNEAGDYIYSDIECIVRTECPDKKVPLVQVGGLRVTPYHPIMNDEKWVFPHTLGATVIQECEAVYSFIVQNRCPMIVDGRVFATWGHGLQGPVIGHEYFGTDRVIDDMKRFTTYDLGIVNLTQDMIKREPTSSLICEINQ